MAVKLPPIPNNPVTDAHVWRDWFYNVSQLLIQQASIAWTSLDFTSSNLQNIVTRQHAALQGIQGGDGVNSYHLTQAEHTSVQTLPTFGTMATQNANNVTITGGTVSAGISLLNTTATTVGAAGTASTLPTLPSGYVIISIGGTNYKLPYYGV